MPIIRPPVPPAPVIAAPPPVPAPSSPVQAISPVEAMASPTHSSNGSDYEYEASDYEDQPVVGRSRSSSNASYLSNTSSARGEGVHRSQSVASSRSSRSRSGSVSDKRFPCPVDGCDKAFARRFNLASHVASTHENRKPFVCPRGCGKGSSWPIELSLTCAAFSRRHDNLRHLASVHDASQAELAAAKVAQPSSPAAQAPVAGPSAPPYAYSLPPNVGSSPAESSPLPAFAGFGLDGVISQANRIPYEFFHG